MKIPSFTNQFESIAKATVDRRKFLRQAGVFGLGAAASGLVLATGRSAVAQQESSQEQMQDSAQSQDTVQEIVTAALIAGTWPPRFTTTALSAM